MINFQITKIKHFVIDVEDNYQMVVFKLVSAFKWIMDASKYNGNKLKWILKLDDDVLLNVEKLKQFLETIHENDFIYCRVFPKEWQVPLRKNKW